VLSRRCSWPVPSAPDPFEVSAFSLSADRPDAAKADRNRDENGCRGWIRTGESRSWSGPSSRPGPRYKSPRARGTWPNLARETLQEIAAEEGVSSSYATRLLRLAFLAPNIVGAILNGRHPPQLTANRLMADTRLSLDWTAQGELLCS
jgi:hypothetical protein